MADTQGNVVLLLGQQDGKVDSQGRTAFPKKFRQILGDNLIITQGYENSLIVVSTDGWKALLEGTEGKPFTDAPTRETQRFLLGGASQVSLDAKGRFILPAYLRTYGRLGEEVIFIGLSRYIEIWDKKRWNEYSGLLEANIGVIAQRLGRERKE
jgi:MraZ protein